ncbi:flavin reductase family protein [Tumebacillus permanentifrigoris]|uniref:Flavin reductase (DIM6/NTAB) family NADH-FMN oxidoreductase RutF n=1 Tax=Tumebacillus permanentifrigoris TaxID=378543 RepID=A0A316D8S5_9BACL|nr:flavin reductase family protein [Tumebacillus permanentifrigoris]PWK10338.1 flavin reductase (DIM6/NTAB) family NADH-FMN oxidoreductase RutF [Tumebacillus permanentifrigoris]
MQIDPKSLPWQDAYKYLNGAILPRPIAFVSSVDEAGILNLAPFSFFTAVAANPLTICFSVMRRGTDGAKKDTLRNIEATREFVVNIVSEAIGEQMNITATEFPAEISEFDASGLTPIPSTVVRAPRVAESLVNFECKLHQIVEVGGEERGASSLVIGEVVQIHVDDSIHENGKINTRALNPIGRLAGHDYVRVTDTFEMMRK